MRTLGMIGGIAPGSTVDYYRLLIAAYRKQAGDGRYLSILINSIDLTRMLDLVGADRLPELTTYPSTEVERRARRRGRRAAGVEYAPHRIRRAGSGSPHSAAQYRRGGA
jgi:aspartate racemase